MRTRRSQTLIILSLFFTALPATAGPTVVPTAEGQIGEVPGVNDRIEGTRFESIRGQAGDVLLGGLLVFGGAMPPPPELSFLTDRIHGTSDPIPVDSTADLFNNVFKLPPASARSSAPSRPDKRADKSEA